MSPEPFDKRAERRAYERAVLSKLPPFNMKDLRPRRARLLFWVSRKIGGRTVLGYRDET